MSKSVYIIGAGQLGSRHLQALKQVTTPLNITVIDPSQASLFTAKERYEGIPGTPHPVEFLRELPQKISEIEIAIVPSNSNVRREIIENLSAKTEIKYLVLEKLLFNKKEDYHFVSELLNQKKTKTFVNCAMRMIPFYIACKEYFEGQKITLSVNGSNYGLASNAIHYLDLISFYTQDYSFDLETNLLDFPMVESKRSGFKEFTGTLIANYSKGSKGILTCAPGGTLPVQIEITSAQTRVISREWEQKAWISEEKNGWKWQEIEAKIPFQSQLTAELVTSLLSTGSCNLVTYEESKKVHLALSDGIDRYFEKNRIESLDYPFT